MYSFWFDTYVQIFYTRFHAYENFTLVFEIVSPKQLSIQFTCFLYEVVQKYHKKENTTLHLQASFIQLLPYHLFDHLLEKHEGNCFFIHRITVSMIKE